MASPSIYKSPEGEKIIRTLYDTALGRWPLPHDDRYVQTRFGPTFTIASGPEGAPPLVLLHGASSNAVSWLGDAPVYARQLRVYAVDLPGEPGRSAQTRPPWRGPAWAEWLSDVLDGLGLARAALLGLSQGGWTAIRFAVAFPERVSRLVLLIPGGVAPMRPSFMLRALPLLLLGRRGAEAVNRITFGSQPIHPEAVRFMDAIMTHFKPRVGSEVMFSDDDLRRLTMPTLVIAGAQDALRPAARVAARLERLLPCCTPLVLPDVGHVLVGTTAHVLPFLLAEPGLSA